MRISRLYVTDWLETGQTIELDDDSAHYVRTVLRLRKDAEIILFNGRGGEYRATIVEASRKKVLISVAQWSDRSVESPLVIAMGLALARGDRMDLAVQKAVELGVCSLTPLFTERCVVQLRAEDKRTQRLAHWRKIVQHAAEQCGRTLLPELTPFAELQDWLENGNGLKIFLDPYAPTSLADLHPTAMKVTLLSGPEGGFADHERALAKAAGFIPVKLGRRILRTETAALAALSAVQMLWGDFARPDDKSRL